MTEEVTLETLAKQLNDVKATLKSMKRLLKGGKKAKPESYTLKKSDNNYFIFKSEVSEKVHKEMKKTFVRTEDPDKKNPDKIIIKFFETDMNGEAVSKNGKKNPWTLQKEIGKRWHGLTAAQKHGYNVKAYKLKLKWIDQHNEWINGHEDEAKEFNYTKKDKSEAKKPVFIFE